MFCGETRSLTWIGCLSLFQNENYLWLKQIKKSHPETIMISECDCSFLFCYR